MMLDVQRFEPTLLTHGEAHEGSELDQLGLAEIGVQPLPQRMNGLEAPDDRLGICQSRSFPRTVPLRRLEIHQIQIVFFDQPGPSRLHRALISAVLALDRLGDIDAAKLLDAVIEDPVAERIAPGIGEGPEDGGHVGADGLALWRRRTRAAGALGLITTPR